MSTAVGSYQLVLVGSQEKWQLFLWPPEPLTISYKGIPHLALEFLFIAAWTCIV